jgi:ABC-type multidrug transport system ATPase subunit/ABC-type multidrug transport system permease subunit
MTVWCDVLTQVCLRDTAIVKSVPKTDARVSNLSKFFFNLATCASCTAPRKDVDVLHPTSLTFKPGRMCLVLGAPGSGKTSLLRLISARTKPTSGAVEYNGLPPSSLKELRATRLASLVEQNDEHEPLLSVRETFEFASGCCDSTALGLESLPEALRDALRAKPDAVISMLALEECGDTAVGNDMVRGVSGGQKRRVTIGEMLLTDSRVLCGDEITNGLDSAVAETVVRAIRDITRARSVTTVLTLQQPTPELFSMFDEICLLGSGFVIYKGPIAELEPYLASKGFKCPATFDLADWLIELVTDPALAREHGDLVKLASPCSSLADLAGEWVSTGKAATTELPPVFCEEGKFTRTAEALRTPSPFALAKYGASGSNMGLIFRRQAKLLMRNPVMVQAKIFGTLLNCCVFGSLFWQPEESEFALRYGVALFVLIYLAFSNFSELPVTFQARKAAYKQTAAGFYSESAFVSSVWLVHLPLASLNSMVASLVIYWFVGFSADVGAFFFFFLCVLTCELCMSSWFRAMSLAAFSEEFANTLSGSSTGIFLLYAGFLLTHGNVPIGSIWLYYWSPFSWITRSIMQSEFGNERYRDVIQRPVDPIRYQVPPLIPLVDSTGNVVLNTSATPPTPILVEAFPANTVPVMMNITQRDAYLDAFDFFLDDAWRWAGVGVVLGYALLFGVVLATVFLTCCRHDQRIGTRRYQNKTEEESSPPAATSAAATPAAKSASHHASLAIVPATLSFHDLVYTVFVAEAVKTRADALAGGSDKGMLDEGGSLEYFPAELEKQGKQVGLSLLRNIHGAVTPGRMIALMGASGAGKTTLLDCLTGRKTQGIVSGTITINGKPMTPSELSERIAYVEQTDCHFPEATVQEALQFSADLRLPPAVPANVKADFVRENLALLELDTICDRPIKTLAPGEQKRVSIGVELCSNPSLLALDEPTTGLDARSASVVMRVISNIAKTGRSVVATIHQPSTSIFLSFDDLLLLERGGRQVYFGEIGRLASKFVSFLEATPGVSKLPPRTNPATWMLDQVAQFQEKPLGKEESVSLAKHYSRSKARKENVSLVQDIASGKASPGTDMDRPIAKAASLATAGDHGRTAGPSVWVRFSHVLGRTFIDYWRNNQYNGSRFIVLCLLATVFGLTFFQLDTKTDEAGVRAGISVLFSSAGFGGTLSFSSLLPGLGKRRPALYRERSVGMYSPWLLYLAVAVCEMLYLAVLLLGFLPIVYFLAGFSPDSQVFFETYLTVWMVATWFVFNAQLFISLFPSVQVAQIVSGAVFLTQINLFSGIFLQPPQMPAAYRWIHTINPAGLATRALALIQFHTGPTEEPVIIKAFRGGQFGTVDRNIWVEEFVDNTWERRFDSHWQIAIVAVVVQILAMLCITFINHSKR